MKKLILADYQCRIAELELENERLKDVNEKLTNACKNVIWKLAHGGTKKDGTFQMNKIDGKDAVVELCREAVGGTYWAG